MFPITQLIEIFLFLVFCFKCLPCRVVHSLIFDRVVLKCTNLFQIVKITVVFDSSWKNKLSKIALQKEIIKISNRNPVEIVG